MKESYFSLGLMSGTSMDGVDASIISSNGKDKYHSIYDEFYEYNKEIREELNLCREKINTKEDIFKFKGDLNSLEKKLNKFCIFLVISRISKFFCLSSILTLRL